MAKNPFQPAEKIAKKLKVLIYGASGSGKTRAGLTFPRPAVIDTENGTDLYAGRPGVPEFSVLRAKTLAEVENAVAFIREDSGRTFDTLIIDAITVLYDVQKDAAAKNGKDGEMNPRLWNRINGRMVALYNSLTNLPVHVVVIARESELYEGEGLNLKKTGTKPDADKKIPYMFDFVVRMKADHSGEIVKSRGVNVGSTMPTVNWQAFEKAAGVFSDGTQASALSDEQAVNTDARAYQDAPTPRSASTATNGGGAPAWWSVLAEYKPFMAERDFNTMREEMSTGAKNGTLTVSSAQSAREYIEKLWDTAIDFDTMRAATKDVDDFPA
jgi:hypothetical protein